MKVPAIFRQFMDDRNYDGENVKKIDLKNNEFVSNESVEGLSSKDAERYLKKYGENSLGSSKNVSAMKIFAGQFKDFLVLILLIATIVSVFMGEITEAIVIATILFLNALMGFLQEYRTEKTLEALDDMVSPNAKVLRDGKTIQISANLIVKDDIVFLESGDSVPADCVVLEVNRFEVDESILTGESFAVVKEPNELLGCSNELNKSNIVYMGTSVLKGKAKVRVVATGNDTQMGKISEMMGEVQKEQTPIQKRLAQMGAVIVCGCLLSAFLVVLIGILRGEQFFEMIVTGLSLAVASVPEGLPAIVTVALSFAVKRMIRKKALVRKLHAVETLGCANLICTDKTGTVTQNKMTVKKIVTAMNEFNIESDGYLLNVDFLDDEKKLRKLKNDGVLEKLLQTFVLCNGSELFLEKNSFEIKNVVGESTEIALLVVAAKFGVLKDDLIRSKFEVYDEIPFDSSKKFMMVFVKSRTDENRKFVFVKGAYDVVLKMCSKCCEDFNKFVDFSDYKPKFDKKNEQLAKLGMRVLAFAYAKIEQDAVNFESDLNFLGLAAMVDPPRAEAKKSVVVCRRAGIKTVMITGDQKLTAMAIAKQVGIFRKGDGCIEGWELDKIDDLKLKEVVKNTAIFARVSPEHKLRIVKAFKKLGNIVAMTGDGVNDAPAIKEANIGVAMGKNGSDVAKQAADLVLMDDNFATLVTAVEEGRIIYQNMRKFIRYLLSCNFGEVLTSLFAMLIGMPVVLLPMQILLINLVTDGLPAIALGLEPAEGKIMDGSPRSIKETIFSNGLISKIITRGILIAITTLTVFTIVFRTTISIELARTATFLTLVSLQLIHVFECKSEQKSIFRINYFNNKKLIFAVGLSITLASVAIWFEPLSKLLKNYPLSMGQVGLVVFFTLVVPIINGIFVEVKNFIRKRKERSIFSETFFDYGKNNKKSRKKLN